MIAAAVWVTLALQQCTLVGTPGRDILVGGNGNDVVCGLGGDDRIGGGAGRNVLKGGAGNDLIDSTVGQNLVFGGAGNDTVWSWDGDVDRIDGGTGYDRVFANRFDRITNVERAG